MLYKIAFLGFGNVGRTLADLLERKRATLRDEHGIEFRITGVASRRLGWFHNNAGVPTDDLQVLSGKAKSQAEGQSSYKESSSLRMPFDEGNVRDWLRACEADVLFETTSLNGETGEPAIAYLKAALEHGAHAITANKGPVVHAHAELEALARAKGKRFLFESTVMDGIPVFSLFRDAMPAVDVCGFRGVLNSTTNVILAGMEQGLTLEDGIRRAQELGCAESDPTDDLNGMDAAVKVCALATVLMRAPLKPRDVQREGIERLTGDMVRQARREGYAYKLVCRSARETDGTVRASVAPERLPLSDPLAQVEGTSSAVYFETDVCPAVGVVEENPGLDATAYGLLADFIRAAASDAKR